MSGGASSGNGDKINRINDNPKAIPIVCRFGSGCTKKDCPYKHKSTPAPTAAPKPPPSAAVSLSASAYSGTASIVRESNPNPNTPKTSSGKEKGIRSKADSQEKTAGKYNSNHNSIHNSN